MILAGPEGEDEEILRGGNFPAFLYDQKVADPEDCLKGLLRSPYFLTVSVGRACCAATDSLFLVLQITLDRAQLCPASHRP